ERAGSPGQGPCEHHTLKADIDNARALDESLAERGQKERCRHRHRRPQDRVTPLRQSHAAPPPTTRSRGTNRRGAATTRKMTIPCRTYTTTAEMPAVR